MIESIDNLLGILHSQRGRELRFEVGQRARLVTEAGVYDLSPTALTPSDMRTWVGPIVPEGARKTLVSQPSADFDYECSGVGTFKVRVVKANGALSFIFVPAGGTFAPPPQPRPSGSLAQPASPQPRRGDSAPLPPSPQTTQGGPSPATATPTPKVQETQTAAGVLTMDHLLNAMFQAGASDLHLSVSVPPMLRKDGRMTPLDASKPPLTAEDTKRLLTSIMPKRNAEEFESRNDTDFAYEIAGLARFRTNVFRDRRGVGGVLRVIPNEILTAEDLKISQQILRLCHLNKGLVLVTGPTGSGKSTTLCALIDYINRNRADHIITIEDPIEFVHENKKCLINQREVNSHTDSFRHALRAALREDPDIVLVGEMRDLETVAIAIETAETGHLVFGTLHTTTAASTVDRVIDQFPADRQAQIRIMLAESLRAVISQTLLRKVNGGRVAALETLIVNPAVSNLIREAKTFQIPTVMQTQKAAGNVMLGDALIDVVNRNLVSAEEAYSKAIDKPAFEALLKRSNADTRFITQSLA